MHELRKRNTVRVRINPCDQDSHRAYHCCERQKITQPVGTMWRSRSQVIYHGQVPQSPERAESDARPQRILVLQHFWKCIAHPADFLEKARDKSKGNSRDESVGGVYGRKEGCHTEKHTQYQHWWNEQEYVPRRSDADPAHAQKRVCYPRPSVHGIGQHNRAKNWS